MSSTLSHTGTSHSHVDRKSLKRPDGFFVALKKFFDGLGKHTSGLLFVAGTIVAASAVGVFLMTRHDAREGFARNAFFAAEKSLEETYKAMVPPPANTEESKSDSKADKGKKKEAPGIETVLYKKFDVDSQLGAPLAKLKDTSETFAGTRAGYEALLEIGNLYLNHGEPAKAVPYFQKALSDAKTQFDRAAAGFAVGHSYEDAGNYAEAAKAYETASKIDSSMKGEILLSAARAYELQKDTAKARATYDLIISQLPTSESAKTAESQKALLE